MGAIGPAEASRYTWSETAQSPRTARTGIDGNWSDLRAAATWMFNHHFGIGIGYDRFATHIDVNQGSFNGQLNVGSVAAGGACAGGGAEQEPQGQD